MTKAKRVLLCVGCDKYDFLGDLNGAQADARNVYELLMTPDTGDYPANSSAILLSPTCSELDRALSNLLSSDEPIDTLTIFFAGHGGIAKGSYYLCMRNTFPGKLSTSAYSLSRLFEIINEAAPSQCNIIIDACESGGLVSNLSTLLKPELIGMANTSGVSIFATSAAQEYSLDTPEGGVGTTQLLRVLRGEVFVQSSRPYLDLVEVGRAAGGLVVDEVAKLTASMPVGTYTPQTPVVWGLNLFGQSRFAKNPAYDTTRSTSLHSMLAIPTKSVAGSTISSESEKLWALLYDSPEELTSIRISTTLRPILQKLQNESDVIRFISGIEVPLREKLSYSNDSFAQIQLSGTFMTLLLPWCGQSGLAEEKINEVAAELIDQLRAAALELRKELRDSENALAFDGLADFFYLPIRISKLIGWCGAGLLISEQLAAEVIELKALVEDLASNILTTYESCIRIISDVQSPYIFTFLFAALRFGLRDIGEHFLGLYMAQAFEDHANFAKANLSPELAYEFIKTRTSGELICTSPLIARPSESLSTLLMMVENYGLNDTVDPYLSDLDHVAHVVFIPATHTSFAQGLIEQGRNHNFQIGHGIWTVSDFASRWNGTCGSQLVSDPTLDIPGVCVAALCASLLFPDRTPWFLLRPA